MMCMTSLEETVRLVDILHIHSFFVKVLLQQIINVNVVLYYTIVEAERSASLASLIVFA